jgi:twitching motility protein PilT
VNNAIQNLIREDKIHQISNVIATGLKDDMIGIDDSLTELVDRGLITFETAYPYFDDVEKRGQLQRRNYRVAAIPATESGRAAR